MMHGFTFAQLMTYIEQHCESRDNEYRNGWEQTRLIVHTLAAVNGAKESARELMPFPWDKRERKQKKMTESDFKEFDAIIKKLNNRNGADGS